MVEEIEDILLIPRKLVLTKNDQPPKNRYLFSIDKEIKNFPVIKKLPPEDEEFLFSNWTIPPQPQGYVKCKDHDFL